jgi:adenylosuccinate lyase
MTVCATSIKVYTEDALWIKETEKVTNHDVKAVEYFIKAFEKLGLSKYKEFIHFGLTSQDINNTAIPLSTKEGKKVYMPSLITLTSKLKDLSRLGKHSYASTYSRAASLPLLR